MKIAVFSLRNDEAEFLPKFCERYNVEPVLIQEAPSAQSIKKAAGCEAASVITTKIGADVIDEFKKAGINFISTRTIGYDHIDIKHAKEVGLGVGNVSYSPTSVSEYTIMLILMANRKIKTIMNRYIGQDYSLAKVQGKELRTQTVGVVGTGKIGKCVIDHLQGFGCKVIAYDPYENPDVKGKAEYVSLDELLRQSDVITFHIPGGDGNNNLIGKEEFAKMKDGVVIVNTARGTLINTEAFLDAIESGKVGAAALDVVEGETPYYYKDFKNTPIPNRSLALLSTYPNVLMTPHTAFYTDMAVSDMVENSIISCLRYCNKEEDNWRIV